MHVTTHCIIEGDLLTHAMEAHYCDCIIEGGLLTHAMEAHYCDCIAYSHVVNTSPVERINQFTVIATINPKPLLRKCAKTSNQISDRLQFDPTVLKKQGHKNFKI